MKITVRFVLLLISSVGVLYVMLQMYGSGYYKYLMEKQIKLESESLTFNIIGQISSLKRDTESAVETTAVGIRTFRPETEEQMYEYLSGIISADEMGGGHIFGLSIAFSPLYRQLAPYVSYQDGKIIKADLATTEDYTESVWFKMAKDSGQPVWTDPYLSYSTGQFFITYAYPVMQDGKLVAIIKADVSIDHLQKYLMNISVANQYIVIIAKSTGVYISHPDSKRINVSGRSSYFPQDTRRIIDEMMYKVAGSTYFINNGKKYLVNYMTIKGLNWSVGIVFDEGIITKPVNQMMYRTIAIIIVGLLFILLIILAVANSVTKPLRDLNDYVKGISGQGITRSKPKIQGKDEIAELTKNVIFMQEELERHVETEKINAAEKERVDSQIRFAHDIQNSFLPDKKILANNVGFSLSSYLKTAQYVGGDLYDFFMLDDKRLFIVIGDVADKGIPASLYMSLTMAFARVLGTMSSLPKEIASYINNYLILYNKNNMFVTMMILVINIENGEVQLLDAGHGMIKKVGKGGEVTSPKTETNIALGIKPNFDFKQDSFTLEKGDMLLLYTDGVTDAVNPEDEQFTEEKLVEILQPLDSEQPAETNLNIICNEINDFCKNAPPADDMAMILFEYKGL